jgi:hypothetical protein
MTRSMAVAFHPRSGFSRLQLRYKLLGITAIALGLTLITIAQTLAAYATTYQLFENVTLENKANIEDSDNALQAIAQVSTDVIDSVITKSNSASKSDAAIKAINSDFDSFRLVMFKVNANLAAGPESDAFYTAERAVYDDFWPHISAMLTAESRGDTATVVQEYSTADGILEQTIIPNLTTIEEYDFAAMQRTEQNARTAITSQLVLLMAAAGGLVIFVTAFSFWLRRKVRRYLTPGLDGAMILCWVLCIGMFSDIAQAPGQMKSLVEDSYYSVGATQRILAIATQANRTESAEVLDATNAGKWQHLFDLNDVLIQQALCGFKDCINTQFNTLRSDAIDPSVIDSANRNLPHTNTEIVTVVPLVANVTYLGEPEAIEQARETYINYLRLDRQIRDLVAQNQLQAAITLDTGDSDVAFGKFVSAVEHEKQINLDQFDLVWQEAQNTLPSHRILFGFAGYLLIIILVCAGVYHRYQEL